MEEVKQNTGLVFIFLILFTVLKTNHTKFQEDFISQPSKSQNLEVFLPESELDEIIAG